MDFPRQGRFSLRGALLLLVVLPTAVVADDEIATERGRRLEQTGAATYHAAGLRGQGVKVAILDTGFRGYRDQLGRALPARVTTRCLRTDGNFEARDSCHGVLCAEVVHALAPEAELLLATWEPERPDQFLAAVRWAREQGARVVSCSVIMPTWSDGEGNGPIPRQLRHCLGSGEQKGDMLCLASAGNTAERHWSGAYAPGPEGWHEWQPGRVDNPVRPWGDDPVSVELCWSQGCAYELMVWDETRGREVGRSRGTAHEEGGCAAVRFVPEFGHGYRARVRRREGTGGSFHLVALGANLGEATARGSIAFPGDGREVVAVGAVDEAGRRPGYSSCGPKAFGLKPDFVAVVPFPSQWRARPFTGTSAAAPQAAALAALLWCRHPDWTAGRVRRALTTAARDLGEPGPDPETGHGLILLPRLAE